jgi:hypothetical protein
MAKLDKRTQRILTPLDTADATQIAWSTRARAEALAEFGALTEAQIGNTRGGQVARPIGSATRWLDEARVFAVDGPDGKLFPAFQFNDGEPRPVVAKVLSALAGRLRGWEILMWFTASSGHLEGPRPVDLLDVNPEAVVEAAAYQATLSDD